MLYRDFYPFYAAQGNPVFYNEEREQEREFDLMKSYYPDTARKIQEKAEMQCQLLDYEGSRLYDEYPDRFMLYHRHEVSPPYLRKKLLHSRQYLPDRNAVYHTHKIWQARCSVGSHLL